MMYSYSHTKLHVSEFFWLHLLLGFSLEFRSRHQKFDLIAIDVVGGS